MSIVLEDKRANRGSGMSAFIGRAEDEKFWKEEMTLEESESEDDSFVDEEADKPDEFDSDFNDSEDDADEDLSDEESQVKATARRKEQTKPKNKYIEPVKRPSITVKKKIKKEINSREKLLDSSDYVDNSTGESMSIVREVRATTKVKTMECDEARIQSSASKQKIKSRPQIIHRETQKKLLESALETEITNMKWLQSQKILEDERAASAKPVRATIDQFIRTISRRGTYKTVTFSQTEIMPKIFQINSQKNPIVKNKVCVITGLPAKYRDPATGHPYANLEAYRHLKKKYHR